MFLKVTLALRFCMLSTNNERIYMNVDFSLYAIGGFQFGGLPSEHTYVTVPGHNFNCFGRFDGGRFVRKSSGSATWACSLYGHKNEGGQDAGSPTGLSIRYDGVCQNVANRVLVLLADDIDARGTEGNVLATLMYGKFGFNLDKYIEAVKSTGGQFVANGSGEVKQLDIDTALSRIAAGQTPDAELDILHTDIQEQEGITLPEITGAQRIAFRPIYSDYQNERMAAFLAIASKVPCNVQIAYNELPHSLVQPLEKCVERLASALGPDEFKNMFGLTPDELKGKLGGFQ
jgi:hypothetical protein